MTRGKPPIKDTTAWNMMKHGFDVEIRKRDRIFFNYDYYCSCKQLQYTTYFKEVMTPKEKMEYFRELKKVELSIRNRYLRLRKWRERGGLESELINRGGIEYEV